MAVDILEQSIADYDREIFNILLFDRTTRKNIRWGTDNYQDHGTGYAPDDEIMPENITGEHGLIIQPRVSKSAQEQLHRTKDKAEVFTPSWLCNIQNNLIDASWFGRHDVFNVPHDDHWTTTKEKILFPADKTWQSYIKENRMEISCGEAPYLASRYDTVTGESIPVPKRIGFLDRKLRIAYENTDNENDWIVEASPITVGKTA